MSNPVQQSFRRSSRCDTNACVEVSVGDQVLIRNSSTPHHTMAFTKEEWRAFVAGVRLGEFEVR